MPSASREGRIPGRTSGGTVWHGTVVATVAVLLALIVHGQSRAQITEIIDSTGDGVAALDFPFGIAVDSAGNAYVPGWMSSNVFKVSPLGTIVEIIDSTGDGAGRVLDGASQVAVDSNGNVYVTANVSDNAFKISPSGTITEIIDSTGDGSGNTLDVARGIAVDSSGTVYIAGAASDNAFKVSPSGTITLIINAAGDGSGNGIDSPQYVAVDSSGNVYLVGVISGNVFEITPAGTITQIIDSTGDGGGNSLGTPEHVAVDSTGNVYVAGGTSDNAFEITPMGTITEIIDATGDGASALDAPNGLAVDPCGNVYVTGFASANAFQITPMGTITEIIDSTGDGIGNALGSPYAIAANGCGNVYVSGGESDNGFEILLAVSPKVPDPDMLEIQEDTVANPNGEFEVEDVDGIVVAIASGDLASAAGVDVEDENQFFTFTSAAGTPTASDFFLLGQVRIDEITGPVDVRESTVSAALRINDGTPPANLSSLSAGPVDPVFQLVLTDENGDQVATRTRNFRTSGFQTDRFASSEFDQAVDGTTDIDMERITDVSIGFSGSSGGAIDAFQFDVDDVSIVPEPSPSLATLITLTTLCFAKELRRRRSMNRP